MGEMFGVQTVESVKGVSNEFSVYIQRAYERVSGGLGSYIYYEKLEEQRTGHKPVPRLGIGCSTIPSAMFHGAVAGFVGGLIFS